MNVKHLKVSFDRVTCRSVIQLSPQKNRSKIMFRSGTEHHSSPFAQGYGLQVRVLKIMFIAQSDRFAS